MHFKTEEEFVRLITAFADKTLPKSEWTHEAHLAVALDYVRRFPPGEVVAAVREAIRGINETHGTPNTDDNGYHETLTVFWLSVIAAFVRENADAATTCELANRLLESGFDSKLPLRHYSRKRLFTTDARRSFVAPDIADFEIIC